MIVASNRPSLGTAGFGCGGAWGMRWFDYDTAKNLIEKALEVGVRYFDTGHSYCDGEAEKRLGKILAELSNPNVVLSTKVGTAIGDDGALRKDYSSEAMERALRISLDRLERTQVDLLMTHGPLSAADLTPSVARFLLDMRERGLTRAIGASCDGQVASAVARQPQFDYLMTTYNWYNRTNLDAMKLAQDNGISVIVKSPLASGVTVFPQRPFFSRTNMWYNGRMIVRKSELIRARLCNRESVDIDELIKFSASGPAVATVVFGTTSTKHLESNVNALSPARRNHP